MAFFTTSKKRKSRSKGEKRKPAPAKIAVETGFIKVVRSKVAPFSENGVEGNILKEEINVHEFITTPARISAQWMFSIEVSPGEWQGFRLYVERPCYVEEIDKVKGEVIKEVKAEADVQRRILVQELSQKYFAGNQKGEFTLGG